MDNNFHMRPDTLLIMLVCLSTKVSAYDLLNQSEATSDGNLIFETELETRWLTSSNIFASPSNESDSFTETAATLRITNNEESRLFFDLGYTPTYRAYLRNTDLNNLDHEFNLRSVYSSGKSSIIFETAYTDARRTDRVLNTNVALNRLVSSIALQTEISPKSDITSSYAYTFFDFENIFTSMRHDLNFELRYQRTEKLTLSSRLTYNLSENDNISSSGNEFSITANYQLSPITNIVFTSAYVGQQTPSDNLSAFTSDLSFSTELTSKTSINFGVYRSARLTSFDFWQLGYGARASVIWQMTPKSSLQIAAEYEDLDRIPLDGILQEQTVSFYSLSSTLRTQLNGHSSVFASITFDSQDSTITSNAFDRQQFQIGYSYAF